MADRDRYGLRTRQGPGTAVHHERRARALHRIGHTSLAVSYKAGHWPTKQRGSAAVLAGRTQWASAGDLAERTQRASAGDLAERTQRAAAGDSAERTQRAAAGDSAERTNGQRPETWQNEPNGQRPETRQNEPTAAAGDLAERTQRAAAGDSEQNEPKSDCLGVLAERSKWTRRGLAELTQRVPADVSTKQTQWGRPMYWQNHPDGPRQAPRQNEADGPGHLLTD